VRRRSIRLVLFARVGPTSPVRSSCVIAPSPASRTTHAGHGCVPPPNSLPTDPVELPHRLQRPGVHHHVGPANRPARARLRHIGRPAHSQPDPDRRVCRARFARGGPGEEKTGLAKARSAARERPLLTRPGPAGAGARNRPRPGPPHLRPGPQLYPAASYPISSRPRFFVANVTRFWGGKAGLTSKCAPWMAALPVSQPSD